MNKTKRNEPFGGYSRKETAIAVLLVAFMLLFLACAQLASAYDHDTAGLVGTVLFLLCAVANAVYVAKIRKRKKDIDERKKQ